MLIRFPAAQTRRAAERRELDESDTATVAILEACFPDLAESRPHLLTVIANTLDHARATRTTGGR